MIQQEIRQRLFDLRDEEYRRFQSALLPTVRQDCIIGVRTPALRKLAKEFFLREDTGTFLHSLPHRFFEENQLHSFIISLYRDFGECLTATEAFLPCVDNWAVCDQLSPAVFAKHKAPLLSAAENWLGSSHTYTVRFGIKILMQYFLDADFSVSYPEKVCAVRSEDYYVRMMTAWYFATALSKQYDSILPYFTHHRLARWTHNKAIQKAVESRRITPAQKTFLRTLRRKT